MDETLPPQRPVGRKGEEPANAAPPGADTSFEETQEMRLPEIPVGSEELRLGTYLIEAKIGEGGMGKVYRCFDPTLKRRVAIKVLHDKYVRDERYKARFLREAQTVAGLSHPAVAQVYSIDTSDGSLSIVMEHVSGKSLEELLEDEGNFPIRDGIELIRQATEGLRAALARGVIHRDVKPSNILVDEHNRVKIVDFGLAKELDTKSSLTDDGIVMGTPQYISPEQGRGLQVDQRSDIYSLGATFYHLITGRPPFEDRSQLAMIVAHVQDKPPAPHVVRGDLPADVSRVIGRMMATDREERYPNYDELMEDLESLLGRRRVVHAAKRRGRFAEDLETPASRLRLRIGLALLAGVLALAGGIALDGNVFSRTRALPGLQKLKNWYVRGSGGGDQLRLDFSAPPENAEAVLREVFLTPEPSRPESVAPGFSDGTLQWTDYSRPFVYSYVFDRLDHLSMYVRDHKGRFDLGIYVVPPDGNLRRFLLLPLRPTEKQSEGFLALRNNNVAHFSPKEFKELDRLVPPYQVFLKFTNRDGATEINLYITRGSNGTETIYEETYSVEGEDWNSGVVVFKTSSSRYLLPSSISLEKIILSGTLSGKQLTELPWQD